MGTEKQGTNVCRLCDGNAGKMLNIFERSRHGTQIVNVIKECLPIIVYRTDPLSKYICESCNESIHSLHKFRKKTLEIFTKHKQELTLQAMDKKVQLYLNILNNQKSDEDDNQLPAKPTTEDKAILTDKSFGTKGSLISSSDHETLIQELDVMSVGGLVNGYNEDTATESDMDLCEPAETSNSKIIVTRKRTASQMNGPIAKKRKLIGPKSRMRPDPRIKVVRLDVYNPHSLLKCAVNSMNRRNVPDFDEKPYDVTVEEHEETIHLCNYCQVIFETGPELAVHEMNNHIRLSLEKVDAFEYWDSSERYAAIRNKWFKVSLDIDDTTEDGEDDDDDDDYEDGDYVDEGEEPEECEEDNLLVPLEETQPVNTTRNAKIVFVNEHPTINGVSLRDFPKDKRHDFYQSVKLNGVRRKFCNLCRYTFKDNWAIELHYMSRTCYYSCNYCGVKYNKNKPSFAAHVQEHLTAGDKKSDKVFVNRTKNGSVPRELNAELLKPYVPMPSRLRGPVRPIKMKSLFERKRVHPATLRPKIEKIEEPTEKVAVPVHKPMTTADLAKSDNQAYFCKKCYQVFAKLDEYNQHNINCTGEIDDPEMNIIRPYRRSETANNNRKPPSVVVTPAKPKIETDVEIYSSTGRPIRHCVKEVVSYDDEKIQDFGRSTSQTPGRFECVFCASVFPTVHSRNSHMRIHKSGFKHAAGKSPAAIAPKDYNKPTRQVYIKQEPGEATEEDEEEEVGEMNHHKRIKQETFEPIVEIHEGHSSKVPSNIGSVSITPLRRNNKTSSVSPAIMQLVQNNPNITIKTKNDTPPPRQLDNSSPSMNSTSPVLEPDRSYKCSSCAMPFANKSNLYFHKKNHCGGSKYPCPFCKKRFGTEATYSSHIFYSHPV